MIEKATKEFTVEVAQSDGSGPCRGYPYFYSDEEPRIGTHASALQVLGRHLPEGSRIRVTVEVLEEGPPLTVCGNPWHEEWKYPHRPGSSSGPVLPLPEGRGRR